MDGFALLFVFDLHHERQPSVPADTLLHKTLFVHWAGFSQLDLSVNPAMYEVQRIVEDVADLEHEQVSRLVHSNAEWFQVPADAQRLSMKPKARIELRRPQKRVLSLNGLMPAPAIAGA
eukprot:RCo012501